MSASREELQLTFEVKVVLADKRYGANNLQMVKVSTDQTERRFPYMRSVGYPVTARRTRCFGPDIRTYSDGFPSKS